jgi:hypothetical protein
VPRVFLIVVLPGMVVGALIWSRFRLVTCRRLVTPSASMDPDPKGRPSYEGETTCGHTT